MKSPHNFIFGVFFASATLSIATMTLPNLALSDQIETKLYGSFSDLRVDESGQSGDFGGVELRIIPAGHVSTGDKYPKPRDRQSYVGILQHIPGGSANVIFMITNIRIDKETKQISFKVSNEPINLQKHDDWNWMGIAGVEVSGQIYNDRIELRYTTSKGIKATMSLPRRTSFWDR